MTPEQFCYWLQGMFELTNTRSLSEKQLEVVRNHLQLVFTKMTPDVEIDVDELDDTDEDTLKKALEKLSKKSDKWELEEPALPQTFPNKPSIYPPWGQPYCSAESQRGPDVKTDFMCGGSDLLTDYDLSDITLENGDNLEIQWTPENGVEVVKVTEDWYED